MRPLHWSQTRSEVVQLWTGFGPVLDLFWVGSESALTGSGLVWDQFWKSSNLDKFWTSSPPVLDQLETDSVPFAEVCLSRFQELEMVDSFLV